jgi:hypothetical protein
VGGHPLKVFDRHVDVPIDGDEKLDFQLVLETGTEHIFKAKSKLGKASKEMLCAQTLTVFKKPFANEQCQFWK